MTFTSIPYQRDSHESKGIFQQLLTYQLVTDYGILSVRVRRRQLPWLPFDHYPLDYQYITAGAMGGGSTHDRILLCSTTF